ncbi:MAG: hypothetical protein ACRDNZ_23135 [Streptosporangiaceae bacterium]
MPVVKAGVAAGHARGGNVRVVEQDARGPASTGSAPRIAALAPGRVADDRRMT